MFLTSSNIPLEKVRVPNSNGWKSDDIFASTSTWSHLKAVKSCSFVILFPHLHQQKLSRCFHGRLVNVFYCSCVLFLLVNWSAVQLHQKTINVGWKRYNYSGTSTSILWRNFTTHSPRSRTATWAFQRMAFPKRIEAKLVHATLVQVAIGWLVVERW